MGPFSEYHSSLYTLYFLCLQGCYYEVSVMDINIDTPCLLWLFLPKMHSFRTYGAKVLHLF